MSDLSLRPRRGTEIVDAAFRLYRQHFTSLLTVSALAYLPVLAVNIVWGLVAPAAMTGFGQSGEETTGVVVPMTGLLGLVVVTVFWMPTLWATLIVAFSERYLGRDIDAGTALTTALGRYGAVTASSLIKVIAYTLGSIFFLIPGVYLYLRYFAVPATAVLERRSASEALERSSVLSRDLKMKIFGTLLLAALLAGVIWIAVYMVAGLAAFLLPGSLVGLVTQIAGVAANVLVIPFFIGVETLLYYDARIRQEGLDIEMMSAALDPVSAPAPAP